MKYKELEVESNRKDMYLKRLKDQLNEAEDKIMTLQKVQYICIQNIQLSIVSYMYVMYICSYAYAYYA